MTTIRRLLHDAAADVPQVDLIAQTWGIGRRRRRRRVLTSIAAAIVGTVGISVGVTLWQSQRSPATTTIASVTARTDVSGATRSTATDERPRVVAGVTIDYLPTDLSAIAPAAGPPKLPKSLTLPVGQQLPDLGPGRGSSEPIAAVILRDKGDGTYRPVLVLASGRLFEIEKAALRPFGDPVNGKGMTVGARLISADGYRAAFVQDREVVFADVRDGSVTRIPLPVNSVDAGGWTPGDRWFAVLTSAGSYRVDPTTRTVEAAPEMAYGGRTRFVQSATTVELVAFDDLGRPTSRRPVNLGGGAGNPSGKLAVSPWGDTVTNDQGRSATGALMLAERGALTLDVQGAYVDGPGETMPRALALPQGPRVPKGACTAMGWATDHELYVRLTEGGTSRLLAWNVKTGRVALVSVLPTDDRGVLVSLGHGFAR